MVLQVWRPWNRLLMEFLYQNMLLSRLCIVMLDILEKVTFRSLRLQEQFCSDLISQWMQLSKRRLNLSKLRWKPLISSMNWLIISLIFCLVWLRLKKKRLLLESLRFFEFSILRPEKWRFEEWLRKERWKISLSLEYTEERTFWQMGRFCLSREIRMRWKKWMQERIVEWRWRWERDLISEIFLNFMRCKRWKSSFLFSSPHNFAFSLCKGWKNWLEGSVFSCFWEAKKYKKIWFLFF